MNYVESLAYLAALGQELRGVKFDLSNIRRVLSALGHPERAYPSAIVAGTNGKGSTAAMLASILACSGYKTGLYSSPHLVRVNERIRIDGREVSDEEFALAFSEVESVVSRLLQQDVLVRCPSFFEFLTATGFVHFARAGVDFAVLEVGMGGRLDATNVVEPEVAVITNVDLDHTEYLGTTHAAIAGEKAGVIRSGRPVISGCAHPEAAEVVRRRAAELAAELVEIPTFARVENPRSRQGWYGFDLALNGTRFHSLQSGLRGRFQIDNTAVAVAAAWKLSARGFRISNEAIAQGVARADWPGRLEVFAESPLTLLDGAHNPAAARVLAEFIRTELTGRPLTLVYASMRDKAIEEISSLLFPLASKIYLTRTSQHRAATPEEILDRSATELQRSIVIEPDPARALRAARRESLPGGVVLAAGSLFLVGSLKDAVSQGCLD
jgi:dihydrofolate synthase/folylpolyglutamate synthase